MRTYIRSGGGGFFLAAILAGAPGVWAVETAAPPSFQELYSLLRSNLTDTTEAELNRAAVQGLLDELSSRVSLVTNGPAAETAAGPLISRTAVYDQAFGYLRVRLIEGGLAEQLSAGFDAMNRTNPLKGLVLDLRFARGSDYAAAAAAADRFIADERALVVWGETTARSKAKTNAIALPVAVLINDQTRGAAEALAAVLRQAGAGLLIGKSTAGGAYIFREFDLRTGQRVRVAVEPIKVGDGEVLTRGGVAPDLPITVSAEAERQYFEDAYAILERERTGREPPGAGVGGQTPVPPGRTIQDPALNRALDLLKGLAVVQQHLR